MGKVGERGVGDTTSQLWKESVTGIEDTAQGI